MTAAPALRYTRGMTPAQMIAFAALRGSPALLTLVVGHLLAGRPAMALLALCLSPAALAVLDSLLPDAESE